MKRLLTTLVILTGLIGSGGAVWADAVSDYNKGKAAHNAGKLTEAAKWYLKAAKQGNAEAQSSLGVLHHGGFGALKDRIAAYMWFNIAGANGYKGAALSMDSVVRGLWEDGRVMGAEEIQKANERAKRCMDSDYKDCDAKAKSWWQKLTD